MSGIRKEVAFVRRGRSKSTDSNSPRHSSNPDTSLTPHATAELGMEGASQTPGSEGTKHTMLIVYRIGLASSVLGVVFLHWSGRKKQ